MRSSTLSIILSLLAAMMLAGCVGDFELRQTEPFRVEINGDGEEAEIRSTGDSEEREASFRVEQASASAEDVTVVVHVKKVEMSSTEPTVVKIITKDETTGETIDEQEVRVEDDSQDITVNVKGHDNIVVITQAVEGDAIVSVSANEAKGNAKQTIEQDDDEMDDTLEERVTGISLQDGEMLVLTLDVPTGTDRLRADVTVTGIEGANLTLTLVDPDGDVLGTRNFEVAEDGSEEVRIEHEFANGADGGDYEAQLSAEGGAVLVEDFRLRT